MIHRTQARYNEAVHTTGNEELLLNLIRLRYGESVKFLPLTSITDQFEIDTAGRFLGGIDQDAPTRLWNGSLFISDRPTLTFDPRRDPEFTRALLSHFDAATIELLSGAGWDFDRLFRLLIKNINGVGNALGADRPTPAHAPDFAEYRHMASLVDRLNADRFLIIGTQSVTSDVPSSVAFGPVDAPALVIIQKEGYGVRSLGEKNGYVLTQTRQVRGMRVLPEVVATSELDEVLRILRLRPGLSFYPIELAPGGQVKPAHPTEQRTTLTVTTRSPFEVMYFLSQGIAVPAEHIEKGLVTVTRNPDGTPFDWGLVTGDLLRVCVARHKPKGAAVAVQYRHYWYYIDDSDVTSKTTLALFRELIRLQKGGGVGEQPLLTLPVGGRR